jgi:HEAT repeat protein
LAYAAASKYATRDTVNKVTLLSASDDHVVRSAAIPALVKIGGPEGKMGLERLLQDPNPKVQVEAAEGLGQLNAHSEIDAIKELLRHKKPEVALRVAAVLGRLGDRSGIAVVRRYIPTDNPHTRDAVRTFGIILGCKFRLNDQGIAEARRCLKKL